MVKWSDDIIRVSWPYSYLFQCTESVHLSSYNTTRGLKFQLFTWCDFVARCVWSSAIQRHAWPTSFDTVHLHHRGTHSLLFLLEPHASICTWLIFPTGILEQRRFQLVAWNRLVSRSFAPTYCSKTASRLYTFFFIDWPHPFQRRSLPLK